MVGLSGDTSEVTFAVAHADRVRRDERVVGEKWQLDCELAREPLVVVVEKRDEVARRGAQTRVPRLRRPARAALASQSSDDDRIERLEGAQLLGRRLARAVVAD